MRRSLILLPLALLLLSGSQPPVGCRVNPETVEWIEERTLPAYTGTEPLTTIHLDLCCFVSRTLQYENLGVFQGAAWDVHSSPVVLQASFDPSFRRTFVVGTAVVPLPDQAGVLTSFDFSIDYAGTSGVTVTNEEQALVESTLAVSDESFFRQPWTIYLRAVGGNDNGHITSGAFNYQSSTVAAAAVAVTYNP